MRGFQVVMLIGCGCGSVSDESVKDAPPMQQQVDAAQPDAPPGPRCDPSKPFANPAPLANINSPAQELAARMTPDELTLYFSSDRGGGAGEGDIYMATRTSKTADFGTPTRLVSIATTGGEGGPMPTPDGLGLLFVRTPAGMGAASDIYLATRTSTTTDFTSATKLSISSTAEDTDAYLTEGGNVLYLTSTRTPSQSYDIWRATKQQDGSFGQAEIVTAANTAGIDAWAVGSEDGKTLYFGSNRAGGNFWKITRPTAGGAFGAPSLVTELETSDDEAPEWLSPDTCVILFHRSGSSGLGGYDVWMAKKPL